MNDRQRREIFGNNTDFFLAFGMMIPILQMSKLRGQRGAKLMKPK